MSKKRDTTPDIIGGLLGGMEADQAAAAPSTPPAGELVKATVYLSPDTLYKVDRILAELRRADNSRRISRYAVIAAAVDLALADIDPAAPLDTDLARRVMAYQ